MQTTTAKLYSLEYNNARTYGFSALFIAGNILLPQLCHTIHLGGPMLLPIYFFTLIGAYKYGTKVGLLTALLSPIINSAIFGMPPVSALPMIVMKGVLLACAASVIANRTKSVSIFAILAVVLMYQVVGCGIEWAVKGCFMAGVQDFRLGVPGMLIQVIGGWAFIKFVLKK